MAAMTVSAVDSAIFGGLFTTAAMRAVFADAARLQRMLDVEAALARAQARLGLIPAAAAAEITAKARLERFDLAAIRRGTELAGYPIVPLVKALGEACEGDAGRYVHWGATTQDIVDTALVLQIRDGLALIEDDLDAVVRRWPSLRGSFATRRWPAAPICSTLCRSRSASNARSGSAPCSASGGAWRRCAASLVVQFGGAAGTLASLGEDGIRVLAALAGELGLAVPPIAWHVARDGLAEAACFLGLLTGSLGKIATDIALLMQTEVGEVAEPHAEGRGGSSTMPQKRNPIASEFILAAAKNVRQLVPVMLDAMLAGPRARDRPLARRVAGAAAGFRADRGRAAPCPSAARGPYGRSRPHAPQSRRHPGHDHGRGGDDGAGARDRPRAGASSGRRGLPAGDRERRPSARGAARRAARHRPSVASTARGPARPGELHRPCGRLCRSRRRRKTPVESRHAACERKRHRGLLRDHRPRGRARGDAQQLARHPARDVGPADAGAD